MKNVLQVHFNKRLQQLHVIRLTNKKELRLPVLRIISGQNRSKETRRYSKKNALRIFLLKHNDAKQHLRWSKTDLSKEIKKMLQEEIFYEFQQFNVKKVGNHFIFKIPPPVYLHIIKIDIMQLISTCVNLLKPPYQNDIYAVAIFT